MSTQCDEERYVIVNQGSDFVIAEASQEQIAFNGESHELKIHCQMRNGVQKCFKFIGALYFDYLPLAIFDRSQLVKHNGGNYKSTLYRVQQSRLIQNLHTQESALLATPSRVDHYLLAVGDGVINILCYKAIY